MSLGSPFFEGTEKKVEIVIDPSRPSFRARGDAYWRDVVGRANAEVLSSMSGTACDAYLLSESSLFVFDHKVIMMTCGCTRLDESVAAILAGFPPDAVQLFIYERKNEVNPRSQPTSFFDDVRRFERTLPGRALKFGHEDEHHLYLFHLPAPKPAETQDMTLEVLMYGLDDAVRDEFVAGRHQTTAGVRAATGVDGILPGFDVDDHLFEPSGYSLNAIRDEFYYTIHVTPERSCSYASFETNQRTEEGAIPVARRVLDLFRPRSYDLVLFDDGCQPLEGAPGYRSKRRVAQDLCGYNVRFFSFFRPPGDTAEPAIELPVQSAREEVTDG